MGGRFTKKVGLKLDVDHDRVTDDYDDDNDFWYDGDRFGIWDDDGDNDDFEDLSRDDCRDYLDRRDRETINAEDDLLICFRSSDDRIGKMRFEDVNDDRVKLKWYLWR